MSVRSSVLWLQGRPHRAGAQTCLARLLDHSTVRAWNPILLCSRHGWLTFEADRLKIPSIVSEFPSSRSLAGRIYKNADFARRSEALLDHPVSIVHANDHIEGLLALGLAKRLGARSAVFLRTPTMTRSDYYKYGCNRFDYVAAIGEELAERVRHWDRGRPISIVHDGVKKSEFGRPKTKSAAPPKRLLVIGSEAPHKGWADLVSAFRMIEEDGHSPTLQLDFTGREPSSFGNDLGVDRLSRTRCSFLGRVEQFRDLVSGYDLVVNPSRSETFGMAAVEVLAAGVPLLSSRTGVMSEIQDSREMLFTPARPDELAARLKNLLTNWAKIDFGVARAQKRIRDRFMIDRAAVSLNDVYRSLTA